MSMTQYVEFIAQAKKETPRTPAGAQRPRTHRNPAWSMYIRGAPGLAYLGVVKMLSFFRDT